MMPSMENTPSVDVYKRQDFAYPAIFSFVMQWGSVLFLLISGICVTLGHHPVRRGLAVFGCGMLCSLVTAGMYWLGFQGRGIIIWFGILHCLGVCMLLWPWLGRLPNWVLGALALLLLALGYWFRSLTAVSYTHLDVYKRQGGDGDILPGHPVPVKQGNQVPGLDRLRFG